MTKHCRIIVVFLNACLLAMTKPSGNPQQKHEAEVPKTIVEMQPFRQSNSIHVMTEGGKEGAATLVNLNPAINAWYLLTIARKDSGLEATYHLENPAPHARNLVLDEKYPAGLTILEGTRRYTCDLFEADTLSRAKASPLIFYPLCDGRIYLRNPVIGHRTTLEAGTEFVRDHVWGGEKIIALGHILMGDTQRETGTLQTETRATGAATGGEPNDLPLPALIDLKYAGHLLTSGNLGIEIHGPAGKGMSPGTWYAAEGNRGVYVSILQPNLIDVAILQSYKTTVNNLDRVEASSLCYLVAFDLDQFQLGYALGTEHPKVDWSDHMLAQMRNPQLPGPDGIGNIKPLVATGLVSPEDAPKTVAVFTGGFKRVHGAFKYGDLALRNHGSHYGFIENGVVFSKLQPGLATIFMLDDGRIEMKTWSETDDKLLPKMKHARQNGVPIIDFDDASRSSVPGALVARWGPGNWSGSEDMKLRTMRSGVALQRNGGRRFFIYAVFSDATPSAMARIFQAYRCDYAMLLDMNALEHTYLAVYRRSGSQVFVDHLVKGMGEVDKSAGGEVIPRFLGYADNRDFFYVMRRNGKQVER